MTGVEFNRAQKNGFTLAEVVVVLVIVAIAAVIAVPNIVGYASKYKKQNCENAVERILSDIQSDCASGRYESEEAVSAAVISSLAAVDSSIDGTPASTMGVDLLEYCNEKNTVRVSWRIDTDNDSDSGDLLGYVVNVAARCTTDGVKGTNRFYCGAKQGDELSDEDAFASFLFYDVISDSTVGSAYASLDSSALKSAIAGAFSLDESLFDAADSFYNEKIASASDISDRARINCALSIYLTVAVNNNEWYKRILTQNYQGADYMPIVIFEGTGDALASESLDFKSGGFALYGLRNGTVTDTTSPQYWLTEQYIGFSYSSATEKKLNYMVNCVWAYDLDAVYFLENISDLDPAAIIKSTDSDNTLQAGSYSGSEWARSLV